MYIKFMSNEENLDTTAVIRNVSIVEKCGGEIIIRFEDTSTLNITDGWVEVYNSNTDHKIAEYIV